MITLPYVGFTQTKTVTYQEIVAGKGVYFGAVMDDASSTITMTISGPNDRWFGVGFGTGMSNGDMLIYTDGKTGAFHTLEPTDYKMTAQNAGGVNKDASQDWTVLSNTETAGLRTIVASRQLNTGDAQDNVLNFTDANVNVVWAKHSSASHTLAYHGNQNRGVKQFTWVDESASLDEMTSTSFEIAIGKEFITVNNKAGENYNVTISSLSGQLVFSQEGIDSELFIDNQEIGKGTFIVLLSNAKEKISRIVRL